MGRDASTGPTSTYFKIFGNLKALLIMNNFDAVLRSDMLTPET
jgi:hypothetical protein